MLTLDDLKKEYIDKVLAASGLPFAVFTDTGDFEKAIRSLNTVTEYINGLLTVTDSGVEYSGEVKIVSMTTQLAFLIRVDDDKSAFNGFPSVTEFREKLSQAFSSVAPRFDTSDGETEYTVVVAYNLPETGTRSQRSYLGDSISYSCTVSFAYLPKSLNTGDVKITIDGDAVNFLSFGISRRPSISANLFSTTQNGETAAYAESAAFVVDLVVPSFADQVGGAIQDYILGLSDANQQHVVTITFGKGEAAKTIQKTMVFGESSANGRGIENVGYTISLVPYATEAQTGG